MKIMIVDDEVIIRTGLARVIKWEELGLTLLEPAASAEEALARIGEERPDIVMTDIRMTGKTGLQLAEEARRLLPELEVIILSGYDDFAYAQQAIRQEVSDYLLKTSRPEEIIKTVLRVKKRIEDKWAARSHDYFREKEARDRLFMRWVIEGETEGVELPLLSASLPRLFGEAEARRPLQTLVLMAEGWEDSAASSSLLLFAVDNMLHDLVPCETLLEKHRIIAVIRGRADGSGEAGPRLPSLLGKIERLLKCRLYCAAGLPVERPEAIHESYRTADRAFGYKSLVDESFWNYADIMQRKGGKTVCTHEEELELSAILLENDPVALKQWVQRVVQAQLDDPQMTIDSLEALVHAIAIVAHRWLERVLSATGRGGTADELPPFQAKLSVMPKDALFQHLYGMMKLYHNKLAEGQATHVQRAMAYIEEQLGSDVGLPQVARHVHLHPNHLSEVFKKETGMTFGDYVTRQKIRRAQDILSVSPAKVSEVAARVGYEDVKYFSQLFKKATGKTPSEFREEAASGQSHGNE